MERCDFSAMISDFQNFNRVRVYLSHPTKLYALLIFEPSGNRVEMKKSDRAYLVNSSSDFFNPYVGGLDLIGVCLNGNADNSGDGLKINSLLAKSKVEECFIFDEDESFIAEFILEALI